MMRKTLLVILATIASAQSACVDTGAAGTFNGVFFGNYQGSSDIEGKIAVQGNATFSNGYSAAYKEPNVKNCDGYTVVVGETVSWHEGQNYNGNLAYGISADLAADNMLMQSCKSIKDPNAFDFASAKATITELSAQFAALADTVVKKTIDVSLALQIEFSGVNDYEVITMQADDLGNLVKTILAPTGVKNGALIIFNVLGATPILETMNQEALQGFNVIFNFHEATSVSIENIAVRGAVYAPNADIPNAQGVIYGPVYAKSMSGPCQINYQPLACNIVAATSTVADTCTHTAETIKCRTRTTSASSSVEATSTAAPTSVDTCDQSTSSSVEATSVQATSSVAPTSTLAPASTLMCRLRTSSSVEATSTAAPTSVDTCQESSSSVEATSVQATSSVAPTSTLAPASTLMCRLRTSSSVQATSTAAPTSVDSCEESSSSSVEATSIQAPTSTDTCDEEPKPTGYN